MTLRIGPHTLVNNLALAPMAGVTDLPFRELCKSLGAGLAASEMITSDTRLWGTRKTRRRLDHSGATEPRIVQIAGGDPQMIADAARRNADLGAQIIDINMGCPAKKVCRKQAGSALLSDESLVGRILDAAVGAVDVPVTLKIRTGPSPDQRNGVVIAGIAERAGIQAIAVHGRTRACKFIGPVDYQTIAEIKRSVSIPVFANGDIHSPQDAQRVLEITGADGLMIGRAAQGSPWIFRQIHQYLRNDTNKAQQSAPEASEVHAIILGHLEQLYAFYGESDGVKIARKHLSWYCKNRAGSQHYREKVVRAETAAHQMALTDDFFHRLSGGEDLAA